MQKICFFIGSCNDRVGVWNGEIIRSGGVGVSGTDTSTVLIAEYFASKGFDTYLIASSCKNNTVVKNVKYYTMDYLKYNTSNFNILVITPSDEFLNYNWGENLDQLIIWCHMQHTFKEESFKKFSNLYPKTIIKINYMNNFVRNAVSLHSPHTSLYENEYITIPNAVLNDIKLESIKKIPHSFIFNTSYRRGGDALLNIFNKLNFGDKTLRICSAYKGELDKLNYDSKIEVLYSVDKTILYNKLAESEYFIYPLVAPILQGANLHKDCSPCSVAEALLNKVIVLTFPVAGLLEQYKDHLVYLPFPDKSKVGIHQSGHHSSAPELYSEEFIDSVINIINFLENNPQYKELIKKRGRDFVIDNFNLDKIGEQWLNII